MSLKAKAREREKNKSRFVVFFVSAALDGCFFRRKPRRSALSPPVLLPRLFLRLLSTLSATSEHAEFLYRQGKENAKKQNETKDRHPLSRKRAVSSPFFVSAAWDESKTAPLRSFSSRLPSPPFSPSLVHSLRHKRAHGIASSPRKRQRQKSTKEKDRITLSFSPKKPPNK